MNSTDLRANVMAFHREVVGGEMPDRPGVPEEAVARRRLRLIAEEFWETMRAAFGESSRYASFAISRSEKQLALVIDEAPIHAVDLVAFADGLADLMYVCEGAFIGFGIDSRPVHAEVQRTNMAKRGGEIRPDGKRLKPQGWSPPDIASILEAQRNAPANANAGQLAVYIAASSSERRTAAALAGRLRAAGITVTREWWTCEGYDRPLTEDELEATALANLRGVEAANVVWVLASDGMSEGAHFELGAASALGKYVVVSGASARRPSRVFTRLAQRIVHDHQAAFAIVCELAGITCEVAA